jgi:hypothetical protein
MTDVHRRYGTTEASAFLTAHGYRVAPATLTRMRCVGGGPAFEVFGHRPVYRAEDLLAWARSRTTAQRISPSERAVAV